MNHLIIAVEQALVCENYYAALSLALAMPDICGWVSTPNVGSKARYIDWFDKYIKPKYVVVYTSGDEKVFLSGNDCYALRCAFLHEGREEITDQRAREVLVGFEFVITTNGNTVHNNLYGDTLQLQVDIFCRDINSGVTVFLSEAQSDSAMQARLNESLLIKFAGKNNSFG